MNRSRAFLTGLVLAALVVIAYDVIARPSGPGPAALPSGPALPAGPTASAAVGATGPASPAPLAGDMTAAFLAKPLPFADAFALARSVRGRSGTPDRPYVPVRTTPPDESVGSRQEFWVYDWDKKRNFKVGAVVRAMTASAKWWIAEDVNLSQSELDRAAGELENRILPGTRRAYGNEWSPGIDGDPRINILVARIPGRAAGYYSSTDEQPRWVYEFSAEREIVFLNAPPGGRLATEGMYGTLAHELCHMIQFNKRARSIVWFSEGQAELCSRVTAPSTSGAGFESLFLQQPDTQLNDWPELGDLSAAHYGGAFLFLEFLRQHAGGEELINAFLSKGIDTPADLDAVLRARGQRGVEDLFADFVAANALIREAPEDRYRYAPGMARLQNPAGPTTQDRLALGAPLRSSVKQYAARYVELPRGAMRLRFEGATSARVIPTDARSGKAFWWSDRADLLDSTLVRKVDLRGVRAATLRFWTWYDIEADFDYGYVEVSTDGGAKWTTLRTAATTADDPNGVNLGNGMSGMSGGGSAPAWMQQSADLSPYAGREVLLRFQYVTDGALNLAGMAIDDMEIPELGWRDDAEADGDWIANGFVRSTNLVRQRYVVQVIRFGARPAIERRVVEDGVFEIDIDTSAARTLLAVTGFAARTTQPAPFTLTAVQR